MHAEEFDFSEDDSDDDIQEERFSFGEDLSETKDPQVLDHVELPDPPTPSADFPTVSLVGDDDGGDEHAAPVHEPAQHHSQAQAHASESHEAGGHDLDVSADYEEMPTVPHAELPAPPDIYAQEPHAPEPEHPTLQGHDHNPGLASGPDLGHAGDVYDADGNIEGEAKAGGNRPAKGARQVSAGEILSGNFNGSINAGDFLGLDTEFTGPPDPLGSVQELAELDTAYPSAYDDDFDESVSTAYDDADAPVFGDPSEVNAEGFAPPADPYDSDEEFEGDEELRELAFEEPTGGPLRLVLVTLICAVLGAGGVFYAPKIISGELEVPGLEWARGFFPGSEAPEVASVPSGVSGGTTTTPSNPAPNTGAMTIPGGSAGTTSDDGSSTSIDPTVATADPVETSNPTSDPLDPAPTGIVTHTVDPDPTVEPPLVVDSGGAGSETSGQANDPGTEGPLTQVIEAPIVSGGESVVPPSGGVGNLLENLLGRRGDQASQTGFPDLNGANIAWISDDRLDMIWRGEEIPEGALEGPVKTLMPHVGIVRVTMSSEQIFEGRLYAAGQKGVWLEFASGRIKLPSDGIVEIERLAVGTQNVRSSEATAATGKRVRVKVPGGQIFGRVQKQHGNLVTIKTDQGGRVVVQANLVESLGARRAVLIHR